MVITVVENIEKNESLVYFIKEHKINYYFEVVSNFP